LNLIRNQDQEITLRAPGIRVCVDPKAEMNKSEAGGQGEFSVSLAARRDVASQPAT
jgi:hypothetical protein